MKFEVVILACIVLCAGLYAIEPGIYRTSWMQNNELRWDQFELKNDSTIVRISWNGECFNYESTIKIRLTSDSLVQLFETRRTKDSCNGEWTDYNFNDNLMDYKILSDNDNNFELESDGYILLFERVVTVKVLTNVYKVPRIRMELKFFNLKGEISAK